MKQKKRNLDRNCLEKYILSEMKNKSDKTRQIICLR